MSHFNNHLVRITISIVVMVRVNPFLAEVEFTTPSLKQQNRGNGFHREIYNHFLTENWDSQLYEFGEEDLVQKKLKKRKMTNAY